MIGAAVSGYLGWCYGYTAVFLLAALSVPFPSAAF
jgi:hypothetical protein